ncbi:MAG TPA: glycosyltransferase family 4 protein, partial [Bryobacteraceae bacterium]|nr:glycosyltransferase family 4 protein [Bryobacteraceae bacterium]
MKLLAITAGAANMYCGSCLRDNALAAELIAQGHDITLLPLYTPTLTDEPNVSTKRVFFGGISVYLEQHLAAFRFTPAWLDRLWDSRTVLQAASRRSIAVSPRHLGELTISMLRGENGEQRKEFHKLVSWLRSEPPPDVVSLPNSLLISLARPIKEALGRPVCCTLQGEDLFLEGLGDPWRTQALDLIRSQVESVDGFVAVSDYYAGFMSRYLAIPESKMRVVPLGINLQGYDTGFRFRTNCFTVGYFARILPEKGLHVLAEAYRKLRRETDFSGATLEAAGYLAPEYRGYLRGVEQEMKKAGLSGEFSYRGVLDRAHKIDFLRSLSVLSVPGSYAEPKGIFLLEAMANEVPVVQPRHGAFPEIIEKTGGGILVEP